MATDSERKARKAEKAKTLLTVKKAQLDPALASLFSTSSGPVKSSKKYSSVEASSQSAKPDVDADPGRVEADAQIDQPVEEVESEKAPRKRKRKADNEELEGTYLQKLAREEAKEQAQRVAERKSKRQKQGDDANVTADNARVSTNVEDDENNESLVESGDEVDEGSGDDEDEDEDDGTIPQHESLSATPKSGDDLDKAARTVFLSNVSTSAITSKSDKKTLLAHLSSFFPSIPKNDPPHKVESLRFRSTAYATAIPKKAAFAKRELMEATTKSTNAYVVYSTKTAAREAARRLNATVVLDRHLRVDEVSHPAKIDHRRCVFVGNLGFVDDESSIKAAEDAESGRKSKKTPAGDVEEGLWQQFMKAGSVESVRVVRDSKTRVGKGFAYVQFTDENGVEAALQFNEKKFPPMLPRKLRVVRAKKIARNPTKNDRSGERPGSKYKKPSNRGGDSATGANQQSLQGRAGKLLGRAGAASMRSAERQAKDIPAKAAPGAVTFRAPEAFVFEGHRASSTQGNKGLRLGGAGRKKKAGRPTGRSAKRGAAWKSKVASGGAK